MGGSLEDAKDIFQEALVIYYEKSVTGSINIKVNENAYLIGISKNLWSERYHKSIQLSHLDHQVNDLEASESQEIQAPHRVLKFLEVAGNKCMELLKAFYYDKLKMEEISQQFGFSGVRSSTVQKFKCLEKVREAVKQKSLTYESFVD